MPTSADTVQISIVEETVYGTTPATPAFVVARITGEGLAFAPTTTQSNEMDPDRQVTDSILTGGSSTGDLSFELSYEPVFELLLEGLMCADWDVTDDNIVIDKVQKSYTIEKQIPVPGGTTQFHRFTGCTVNGFTLNIAPNQPITGSFTMLGKAVTVATTAITGATYADPDLEPVMAAPNVVGIEIGGVPAVSSCFNNISFTMNNNNRAIECIGTLGAREVVLGRAELEATFSVLFSDSTLLNTLINQTESSLEFTTNDTNGVGYTWLMPRIKFSAAPVVASGTNTDVVTAVTARALKDSVSGTSLEITRTPR